MKRWLRQNLLSRNSRRVNRKVSRPQNLLLNLQNPTPRQNRKALQNMKAANLLRITA